MNENMNKFAIKFPTFYKVFNFFKVYGLTLVFCLAILVNIILFGKLITSNLYYHNFQSFFLNDYQIHSLAALVFTSVHPHIVLIIYGGASVIAVVTSIVFCKRMKKPYAAFVSFVFFTLVLIWTLWSYALSLYNYPFG